jgi:hypothetical protein
MQTFYFVAGEQVITVQSRTVIDAWMKIENRNQPIAAEFRRLPIEAWTADGKLIATHDWAGWHRAVLLDTYGENFQEILDNARQLAM